jgi:hypothetical protein
MERFRLVVSPSFPRVAISGCTGVRPDTDSLRISHTCKRSKLPRNLSTFVFTADKHHPPGERLANFYHMGEFFLVSSEMLRFLIDTFSDELEYAPADLRRSNGTKQEELYFAAKITRVIDAIDPQRSFVKKQKGAKEEEASFLASMISIPLSKECEGEFSNDGVGQYKSYPNSLLQTLRVEMKSSANTTGAKMFEPRFWPGNLLVEDSFARKLNNLCSGGAMGYYFWELDLADVRRSWFDTSMALR